MLVRENIEFQRGKDPKEAMGIGLESQMEEKYGKKWKIFKRCNDLAHISENFQWVSEIQFNEKDPYFNIESYFYYTDEENAKYNLQYVVILYPEEIYAKEIINKDDTSITSVNDFVEFTEAFEPDDREWQGLFESLDFERGKDPKESIGIGWKSPKHFSSIKDAMKYVADHLPLILGREEIPANIIKSKNFINSRYEDDIAEYIDEYITWDGDPKMEPWSTELFWILQDRGFLFESIDFKRGQDPHRALGIGEEGLRNKWGSLKKGDKLKVRKFFATDNRNHIIVDMSDARRKYRYYNEGEFLVVENPAQIYDDGAVGFTNRHVHLDYTAHDDYFIWGSPVDMEEVLMKVNSFNESASFERGKDSKDSLQIGLYHERQLNKAREEIKKAMEWIVDNHGGSFRVYKAKIVPGKFGDGIKGMWRPPSYSKKYSIDFFRDAYGEYYYGPEEYDKHGNWNASHGGRSSAMEAAREIIAQWGGKVDESVSFERGEDPKTSLNIGRNRKVKAGDQIEVYYRGKKHVVTAVTDEVKIKGKVCVRSGGLGGYREPEYESRIIKSVFIKDKEGNHFQADATESWDNEGNTIFPWKIEEYHELVLEAIDFERGKDPKDALEIGSPLARLADELGMTYAEIKQDKKDLHEIVAAAVDPPYDEPGNYTFSFYVVADDPRAFDIDRGSRLHDVAIWADEHSEDAIRIIETPDRVSESINFQRGNDPKRSMNIGYGFETLASGMILTARKKMPHIHVHPGDRFEVVRVQDMGGDMKRAYFYRLSDSGIRHTQAPEEWEMWPEFFNEFLQVTDIIKESVNFQRGKDPKQALGVGLLGQRGLTIDHGYVRKGPRRIASVVDIVQALSNYYREKRMDRAIFRFPANTEPLEFLATARPGEEMDWPEQGYRKISYEEIVSEIITLAQNDPDFVRWIKPSVISYEWDNWQPLLEEVNFERGIDPKRAMGLGLVKVKGDRGVGDYMVRLIKPYEGDDAAPGEEVWEIEYTNDTELAGARGFAYKYPSSHVLSMRGYWGEIDAFINESINFERGKDPKRAMGIGRSFYNLKPGDILKPKVDVNVGPRTNFIYGAYHKKIWQESYLVVIDSKETPGGKLKIYYYQSWDLAGAQVVRNNIGLYQKENSMTGTERQFKNRFEIYRES